MDMVSSTHFISLIIGLLVVFGEFSRSDLALRAALVLGHADYNRLENLSSFAILTNQVTKSETGSKS